MKTFNDGQPMSGWHWVCPCGWSTHVTGSDEINAYEFLTGRIRKHREWHAFEIQQMLAARDAG